MRPPAPVAHTASLSESLRGNAIESDLDQIALEIVRTGDDTENAAARTTQALQALEPRRVPPAAPARLLAALAATAPDKIEREIAVALAAIIQRADIIDTHQPALDEAFALLPLLIPTPAASELPEILREVLSADGVHDRWARRAGALLAELRRWRPDLIPAGLSLVIAEGSAPSMRQAIFQRVVVPSALADPAALDVQLLRRIHALPTDPLEARYLAGAIAEHSATPSVVRDEAARLTEHAFPLRQAWRRLCGERGLRALCVQNIADGQGDEIVRVVPLLQALLDSHRETTVTLITDRGYLYGHPRLQVISFDERSRIDEALAMAPDVLIEFSELDVRYLNHDPGLISRFAQLRHARCPLLDIQAKKGWDDFAFKSVRLGGMEWSAAMKLDRRLDESVYDPAFRLIMELGLPLRFGEMPPRSGPVLAARPEAEADAEWQAITAREEPTRPVALVNPFGGAHPNKGFVEATFDDLARLLISLMDDGYRVALCTHSAAWAGLEHARAVRARLPAPYQRHLAVIGELDRANGDADAIDLWDVQGGEAARAMRRQLRFVARADLIVTVEGWMHHAAYLLGKPYQALILPYSSVEGWHPWGRSCGQRFRLFAGESALDRAPLPERPRKRAWLALLDRIDDTAWAETVARACESEDRDIRTGATRAIGRIGAPGSAELLVRLLTDPSHRVRGAAAEALLTRHRSRLGSGTIPPASVLEPYRLIAGRQPDWPHVFQCGEHGVPALHAAHWGEDPIVRREAATVLEMLTRRGIAMDDTSPLGTASRPSEAPPTPGVQARSDPAAHVRRSSPPRILVLTPLKDVADGLADYLRLLRSLSYSHDRITLGLLESDSRDGTFEAAAAILPSVREEFAGAQLWQRDFGFVIPPGIHRGDSRIQRQRRGVLARSRNHLLSHALTDEDWVLWLDADLIAYPPDIIERLLASGKRIVQPHCVLDYGGPTFDQNAWRDAGRLHLDDLRGEGDVVPLDTVGATMLLIHADLHRDGLVFPPVPYRPGHPRARRGDGEIESEGLGLLATDMGETCWGIPDLEILHRRA